MSKKKGASKRINNKPTLYKIQNEDGWWLSIMGNNPKAHWNPLKGLADTFGILRIEGLKERFPELDFSKLKMIAVNDDEIYQDKEKYSLARS